jgi:hypothetical protein
MPIGLDGPALASRAEILRGFCRETGRDMNGVRIVARPDQPFTRELVDSHRALGVEGMIADPPMRAESLDDCRSEMERTAEVFRAAQDPAT